MPLSITWPDIAIRLVGAVIAGLLIGLNRSEHGHVAGLRTTTLVSLAACVAMIQVNLLLPLAGKASSSFIVMDLMRLPLGILSGMGFIGAGAIVRRDNFIVGVTTAAAMWFVTVIGLCFGGGQIALGFVGLLLGMSVLAGLKFFEDRMKQDQLGKLLIVSDPSGPAESEIRSILERAGFGIVSTALAISQATSHQELTCNVEWRANTFQSQVPESVHSLARRSGVIRVEWTPQAR